MITLTVTILTHQNITCLVRWPRHTHLRPTINRPPLKVCRGVCLLNGLANLVVDLNVPARSNSHHHKYSVPQTLEQSHSVAAATALH